MDATKITDQSDAVLVAVPAGAIIEVINFYEKLVAESGSCPLAVQNAFEALQLSLAESVSIETLTSEDMEKIAKKLVELATGGDIGAARLLLLDVVLRGGRDS